jgi:acyl-CoA hydrolase
VIDLSPFVRPGAGVWWSQASAEPTTLVHALLDQAHRLGPVRAFAGMSWDQRLTTALPPGVTLVSYGALGALRSLGRSERLQIVPCHYSALPRLFASGRLPHDVGLVQVSPPDASGCCSLGIGVDYVADAVDHTPTLIAEINERMPATTGSPRIPVGRFSAVIRTDRPLLEAPHRVPDGAERAIAGHVAELVGNGATIQVGVGLLPTAVLGALSGHSDLAVHSGIISDPVLHLVDKGVITGARKEIDPGLIVAGSALGSAELYARIPGLPAEFRPASYTHAPAVLARLRGLVAINSALQVDLTGQVNAEVRRGRHLGGIGGQADFSRAAASTGSGSIIALRSAADGRSTIVAALDGGVVTTGRADVDAVVTEHGVARLTGVPIEKRAARLIAIAAPEYREALERAFARTGRHRTELAVLRRADVRHHDALVLVVLRDAGRIGVQVPGHPPHRRRHVLLADRLGDRAVGPDGEAT